MNMNMFSFWVCFLVILLKSNLSLAQNVNMDSENSERTIINIYPKVSTDYLQEMTAEELSIICDGNYTLQDKLCQKPKSSRIAPQESSSMFDTNEAHRLRQSTPRQSYPSFVNNGNSVHIQGNFQGSPPGAQLSHQSEPSNFAPSQTNIMNESKFPLPQSPLVAFNLHSAPQFSSVVPNSNNPHKQVDNTQAIFRINSKLLVNTTDVPTLIQALEQPMPIQNISNERPNIENLKHEEQLKPDTSLTTPASIATTKLHNVQSTLPNTSLTQSQNPPTTPVSFASTKLPHFQSVIQTFPLTQGQNPPIIPLSFATTKLPHFQSVIQSFPLTQGQNPPITPLSFATTKLPHFQSGIQNSPLTHSQSLALLKSQTSLQHNEKDTIQYPHNVPNTATQNTISIKVPSGSSILNHQHQADMADILTNLQILTILMNRDDENKFVFNKVQNVPVNSSNSDGNIRKVIADHHPDDSQLRNLSKKQDMYPSNPQQPQARTKAQIINSLPSYANQFAFRANPQSILDKTKSHISSQATTQVNIANKKTNKLQGNHGINIPRINYPSLSSILQGADDSNYYNQLVSQVSLSQILSGIPSKPTTVQSTTPLPTAQLTEQQLQQLNNFNKFLNIFNNRHQILSQQNALQPNQNDSNISNYQDLILASILQSQVFKKPTVTPPGIVINEPYVPANLLQSQDLKKPTVTPPGIVINEPYVPANLLQSQVLKKPIVARPGIVINDPYAPANLLQSQVLKKPTVAPLGIVANEPYVPAIHGSGSVGLEPIISLPPAPPPPSTDIPHLQSFPDNGVPFPVRTAGGTSSYESIQDCLKNTACALFLAGVVATGTTAALAIPVLTPLLGAGLMGKRRRRREIRYFILKPEDSLQFVDNYFQYANGTLVTGLTEDVKCIYNSIMNPDTESSKSMLGNLFRYIIQNKDKLLNISIHEVETRYQKPIPESFLQSLRNNVSNQLDLLNKTLSQNVSEEIPHNLNNQKETEHFSTPNIDSYKDKSSHDLNNMSDIKNVEATLPVNLTPDLHELFSGKGTFSATNNQPIYEQHYSISDNNQASELHAYQTGFSQNMPNGHPLHKFQPIPPPQLHLQRSSIPDYLENPLEETKTQSSSSLDATLDHYLSSTDSLSRLQFSESQLLNPQGFPQDISSSSQLSGIGNVLPYNFNQIRTSLQYPQTTYYFGNHQGLVTAPQNQVNQFAQQQEQALPPIAQIVEFYQTLCHALSEPGIPRSSVITFIAQRCLLFVHAGLIK